MSNTLLPIQCTFVISECRIGLQNENDNTKELIDDASAAASAIIQLLRAHKSLR